MKTFSILLSALLFVAIPCVAWAKRTSPKPVPPVVHDGVKYVAPNISGREGKVEALDEKTGKKLWDAAIYKVKIDPNSEEDVQWVFITKMTAHGRSLVVTNEKNENYVLDLKTRKARKE